MIKITLPGRVPSKKNSKMIVCRGSRPMLLPSKQYKEWHDEMYYVALSQTQVRDISLCDITIRFYAPDHRKADSSNKAESIMDLLVDCGVLRDDSWFIVSSLHLIFCGVDKENPRVEILIEVGG